MASPFALWKRLSWVPSQRRSQAKKQSRSENLPTCVPYAQACAQFRGPGLPHQVQEMWGERASPGNRNA